MLLRILVSLGLAAGVLAADVEEKQTIRKSFQVGAAPKVEVDNIWGSIRVTAGSGNQVEIVAYETFRADDAAAMQNARKEVKLDLTQTGDTVKAYVDGPFRCNCDCRDCNGSGEGRRGRRWRGDNEYITKYDFEIKAPAGTALHLRAINDAEIRVSGITGDYNIENINGGIEVLEAAGSGRVYALNGGVKVTFRSNPRAASTFGSLNGEVELQFQPDLAADLRMKTFNGEIYSDFPVTALPRKMAPETERQAGKVSFKADKYASGRIGSGGPEIKLDMFNGDARLVKR